MFFYFVINILFYCNKLIENSYIRTSPITPLFYSTYTKEDTIWPFG